MTLSFPRLWLASSLCLFSASSAFAGPPADPQRQLFLRAEQAVKLGLAAEAESLMAGLADYPLLTYLLYQKLDRELDNGPAVADFIDRHGQTRQAVLLRQHWLERLAEQGAWAEVAANYRDTDNVNMQCMHALALANLNRSEEAFAVAEKLWPSGSTLPENCERLFDLWRSDPGFTPAHVWKRFALAMQKGNLGLADGLHRRLPPELRTQADFWRQVHDNPRLVLSCTAWDTKAPPAGRIFAYGIDRLAGREPLLAQTAWALHKNRYSIDAEEAIRIDRRTALALAAQRHGQAGAYLLEMPKESVDPQIRGWRVRAALARQDWLAALAGIELLEPEEKNQAQWRYWRARSVEALGDRQQAQVYYRLAAQERDFYGFNAADRIGGEYPLASRTLPVAEAELGRLADSPPFLAIRELLALGRKGEARGEWMYAIQSLPAHDLLAAAKLAQRWNLDNLAILTVARAGDWDDLPLRFPLGYAEQVVQSAHSQQVDPVLVYALVRRESAFDANAGSSVGAMGLMQLMPATGELMARRLHEALPSAGALLETGRNLRYGAAYLRGLLDRFGNQFALAAAAYNAGPSRVERWLPAGRAWPADLWVETIPFSETRQYVAAVLSHAVVYQARLNRPLRRIGDFLPEVPPGTGADAGEDSPVSVPFCE